MRKVKSILLWIYRNIIVKRLFMALCFLIAPDKTFNSLVSYEVDKEVQLAVVETENRLIDTYESVITNLQTRLSQYEFDNKFKRISR